MSTLPRHYSVGDSVRLTQKSFQVIWNASRSIHAFPCDNTVARFRPYIGQVATVTHRFLPGYEMTIRFADGQHFHAKDNWVEPVTLPCFAVFMNVCGERVRHNISAPSIYAAIDFAKAFCVGVFVLAYETEESQARRP